MVDDRPSDIPTHVLAALERLRRRTDADLGRLLPKDMEGFRGSHGRILDLIDDDGSRPTDIADGAWITKQAISKRVGELEDLGLVKTRPDPADGRAVLVRRTPRGNRVRTAAVSTIQHMEREWSERVGAERYRTFLAVLDELGRDDDGNVARAR